MSVRKAALKAQRDALSASLRMALAGVNVSKRDLAAEAGVSEATLYRLLSGLSVTTDSLMLVLGALSRRGVQLDGDGAVRLTEIGVRSAAPVAA